MPEKTNENSKKVVELIAFKLGVTLAVVNAFRIQLKLSNRSRKIITLFIL